jgi:hypothetical protein
VAKFDTREWAEARADAPAAVHDSWLKTWGRRAGYALLTLAVLLPWPLIAWGRAVRSVSAPAVLEEVWPQGNGRFTVGAFWFSVDGSVYHGEDAGRRAHRGSRTWSPEELEGMHVCYDPARPDEDFALTPARYRCGDPDIITTDGGW